MGFSLKSEEEGTAVKKLFRNCLRKAEKGYSLCLQLNLFSKFSYMPRVERQEMLPSYLLSALYLLSITLYQ